MSVTDDQVALCAPTSAPRPTPRVKVQERQLRDQGVGADEDEDEDGPIELDENTQRLHQDIVLVFTVAAATPRMAVSRPSCLPERMRPAGFSAAPAPFQRRS